MRDEDAGFDKDNNREREGLGNNEENQVKRDGSKGLQINGGSEKLQEWSRIWRRSCSSMEVVGEGLRRDFYKKNRILQQNENPGSRSKKPR